MSSLYTFSPDTKQKIRKFRLSGSRAKKISAEIYKIDPTSYELQYEDPDEGEGEGTLVHRHLRRRKQVNYTLPPPVLTDAQIEQMDAAARGALAHDSPRRRAGRYGGGSMYGSFHSAQGGAQALSNCGALWRQRGACVVRAGAGAGVGVRG